MKYLMKSNSFAESKRYLKLFEAKKKTDDILYHLAVNMMNFLSLEVSNLEIKYYKSWINIKNELDTSYISIRKGTNEFQLMISGYGEKDEELRQIVKKYYIQNRPNIIDNSKVYEIIDEIDLLMSANKYNL